MAFIAGTILMVTAIVLLGCAKYVITQWEESSWIRNFAGTETMALMITTLSAFGIALLFAGVAANQTGIGYVELAASIGVIVLAAVGVARLFRRMPVKAPADTAPSHRATI